MIDFSNLGDIEGQITSGMATGKRVIVVAEGSGKRFTAIAEANGKFHLGGIVAGTYALSAYAQHDQGWDYFQGRSYPFKFAEPFGVYLEPIKVRARWTSEGADIKLY